MPSKSFRVSSFLCSLDGRTSPTFQLKIGSDQGILVDDEFKTSVPNIYAAGDVCTAGWTVAPHWFQVSISSTLSTDFFSLFYCSCDFGLKPDKWAPSQVDAWPCTGRIRILE